MCGIIGYAGERNAAEVLIGGLKKLEYRGYDSAGIALEKDQKIAVWKAKGKVAALEERLSEKDAEGARLGIGHTRWATHGAPSDRNAHPHRCGKVVLVHNGIIENERELRNELTALGETLISDTDTELIAALLNRLYSGDPLAAIRATLPRLKGSYALCILFSDQPGKIFAVRKDSPLIIAGGEHESFIASDIPAVLEYTHRYWLPEEGELAVVTEQSVDFYDCSGNKIQKEQRTADWDEQSARKGGYPHFMAKEIAEQPRAVHETIRRCCPNDALFPDLGSDFQVRGRICIVACGSAYHAGLMGKYAIEKFARIPTTVEIASEFRYADPILNKDDLVIIISQSGETADSLAALRLAKERGVPTLGIVNVWGSSLAREAGQVLYTAAGPEISVATTKAYTCQAVLLSLLALRLAAPRLTPGETKQFYNELNELPVLIEKVLKKEDECRHAAQKFCQAEHLFFIGRGPDYAACCEGSLKLKEISYLHSEAYAAGELKHGTISLIEEGTPVIAIMTDRTRSAKTASNIREVHARGAHIFCITHPDTDISSFGDDRLDLPECTDLQAPVLSVILTQLLAYHTAVARGNDVDQPRNLAKSVTVE